MQGYKYKKCNYRYIVAKKIDHKSAETKCLALELYLEGGEVNRYCSDYWKSYKKIIPREKYTPSKSETFTVEGYNARIRHYLARFRRKSKCYSKAVHMIENSLKLLILKLNNQLAILN